VTYAAPAQTATWEIGRTVTLEETYTDNLRLTPPGTEQGDWVTTLSPTLSVRARGDQLRFDVVYSPQLIHRAREGSDDVVHKLNANVTAELVKQMLFLDARSIITQQNVSALGPQSQSNINDTGNRETVRSTLLSPFLRHDFGLDARVEARYTYSIVDADSAANDTLSSSTANGAELSIRSGPTFKLVTWHAEYTKQHIDYDDARIQDIDIQRISAGAKRLVTPQIGVLANVGYEDNNYLTTGRDLKGAFWNVGTEWSPSPRTRLAATAGRNYEGITGSLDFGHCTRLSAVALSYTQDISTARAQTLLPRPIETAERLSGLLQCSIPNPDARQAAVNAFIDQAGAPATFGTQIGFNSSVPFLQKRWTASIGSQGVRNTVMATVYTQTREALGPVDQPGAGDFAQSDKMRDSGAAMLWTTRLTTQTTFNFNAGLARTELIATGLTQEVKFVRFALTHNFSRRLSGTLSFTRQQGSNGGPTYSENALSGTITARF